MVLFVAVVQSGLESWATQCGLEVTVGYTNAQSYCVSNDEQQHTYFLLHV